MQQKISKLLPVIILLMTGVMHRGNAQEVQPVAVGTQKGVWVYLGNEIPKGFQYRVFKRQGNGKFNPAGTITFDDERSVADIGRYNGYFEHLEAIGEEEIAKLQHYASIQNTTDSIYIHNFPVMHLVLGTAFFDAEAKPGSRYQYRIVKTGDRSPWEKTSNELHYSVSTDISKPVFMDKQESSSQILLRWHVASSKNINSFNVQRRFFAQGDFEKVNVIRGYNTLRDSLYLIVLDTTVQMPGYYEYCILPLDIYGNPGPKSDPVGAGTMGSGYNPLPEYFVARGLESGHRVELAWKFERKKYLRSIEVYRSASYDEDFIKIAQLSPDDTTFVDVLPVANENFWYYLKINGPTAKSLPTAKVAAMYRALGEKPLPPDEVGAESIRGGVRVHWMYGEPHAKGFYVYRYEYEKAEYVQASGLIPAGEAELYRFVDSSAHLAGNETYRYAVRSMNDVDQLSDLSPSASASPGIRASIKTPVNLRISTEGDRILLIWDDLREEEAALLGYKVYKKTEDREYALLDSDTLNHNKNYRYDSLLRPRTTYSYSVSAIDFYGNESEKSLPVVFSTDPGLPAPPSISRAVNTGEGIAIAWGQIAGTDDVSVNLYRMQPGGTSALIATVSADSGQYLDKDVLNGQLYIYELSLVTGDNRETVKSTGVSVRR